MGERKGHTLPVSIPRRLVCDLLQCAQRIPSIPVMRRMNVAALVAARELCPERPSWVAVFTKAYARVAADRPELRRCFINYPWPKLYEHPGNLASIAMERDYQGESATFFIHLKKPEQLGLLQIDRYLKECKEAPVERVGPFRKALWVSRLPRPIRRFLWWWVMNWTGFKRARRLGTFGVTVYSGLGARSLHPISPLTTAMSYGVIDERGDVEVLLVYDHRVMDGAFVARALGEMDRVLQDEILTELQSLGQPVDSPVLADAAAIA
jgi:hypothetical protein